MKLIQYSGTVIEENVAHEFLSVPKSPLLRVLAINNFVKSKKPDVVLVAGLVFPIHIILLRLILPLKVKFVVQHHAERPLTGVKAICQRFADKFVQQYFFASLRLAEQWIEKKLIDSAKVSEVMEASSVFSNRATQEMTKHTSVAGHPAYLWVGGLHERKDPITAISGFAQFCRENPSAQLYMIYGSNELENEVKATIYQLGVAENIFLIGKLHHADMLRWYNTADFIISTSHYEGSGIAVCEAMSCGCIPIVTSIPSFRMMTDEGRAGIIFEAGSVESLNKALHISLQIDKIIMRDYVLKRYHEKLSFAAIAKDMESVFRKL